MDGLVDGLMVGWLDGWMVGWMDAVVQASVFWAQVETGANKRVGGGGC